MEFEETGNPEEMRGSCPQCLHHRRKLYYNREKKVFHCKHCGYSGYAREGNEIHASLEGGRQGTVKLQSRGVLLQRKRERQWVCVSESPLAMAYLESRGVRVEEAIRLGIKVTRRDPYTVGILFGETEDKGQVRYVRRRRFCRPYHQGSSEGILDGIQGRKGGGKDDWEYWSKSGRSVSPWVVVPRQQGESISIRGKGTQYRNLVLVEGPFDLVRVWRALEGREDYQVSCLFGKGARCSLGKLYLQSSWEQIQVELIHVLLDSDAEEEAASLCRFLNAWGIRSRNLTPRLKELGKKDPDCCTEDEIRKLIDDPEL